MRQKRELQNKNPDDTRNNLLLCGLIFLILGAVFLFFGWFGWNMSRQFETKTSQLPIVPILIGLLGAGMCAVGGSFVAEVLQYRRKMTRLGAHGVPIQTRLIRAEENLRVNLDNENPWRLVTEWTNPDDGQTFTFLSDHLWFDPSPYLSERPITVLIEPGNPCLYHIDLSFLPSPSERLTESRHAPSQR